MKSIILLSAILTLSFGYPVLAQEAAYTPQGDVRPTSGKVELEKVRLLAPQETFEQNIGVQKLADFVSSIQKCVSQSVPADADGFELLVKVNLSSHDKPKYEMSSNGKAVGDVLQTIYERLQKLPDMRTKADDSPFEAYFKIKPKT